MLGCRCCGKPVPPLDRHPIHTLCIPKHWGKHSKGVNNARCREFGKGLEDWMAKVQQDRQGYAHTHSLQLVKLSDGSYYIECPACGQAWRLDVERLIPYN